MIVGVERDGRARPPQG